MRGGSHVWFGGGGAAARVVVARLPCVVVDLPNGTEREAIWRVQIAKSGIRAECSEFDSGGWVVAPAKSGIRAANADESISGTRASHRRLEKSRAKLLVVGRP
jgi:hypothetical protein